ncbi:MAG: metal ABC transporter permease, partial [Chlamydiae bacterium]|nr:metal ABC transporter permease [Chlamydiota bacterium]
MRYKLIDFFTDPILRAPMLGSLCMCLAASLIGVCVFLRKKSLLGETLSHASYPGLMVSALLLSYGAKGLQDRFFFVFLLGAWIASMMGLLFMTKLQKKFLVKSDAALCFTLASFFGVGVLLASCLQFSHPAWYRQVQVFLYGQTATLLDEHVKIYAMFLILVLLFLLIFYRPIRIAYFDPSYAQSIGISMRKMDLCFFVLLGLGVTIAMKSIGIVLLSGMLIAPALGARQITSKLSKLLVIAAILGTLS